MERMMLELEKITKYYEQGDSRAPRVILDELSLVVKKGESVAIVGPSGSGKSTLLNIISALDYPNSGAVLHDGRDIGDLSEKELAQFRNRKLGFVFQSHHLLPQLNLLENVLLPLVPEKDRKIRREGEERAGFLLDYVDLSDLKNQRPAELSGGECQRAAVVRALIHQPDLLLADEPTGSLDQKTADQLGDLLVNINQEQGISLVVVTHSMELAKKMNRIYRLEEGKLKEMEVKSI